ncbi:U11/U12 small nuclear ribonucleoprotein 48 kDa protein [Cyprinodon tularosa]|uniref:U11/U12 small nuclear ribonucleoprotein 48 kDa protein n=1 Tax=Cyprinodon tularosa TaxID=77115 RepID=UPI0018E1DD6E|nr:U11/U12 small nuclear ribonucleoprotein 48 kDa protein [Cyprinodon tularosa]
MSASIPPETVQDRLDRLKELTEFTEKCKKQLNEIFETLGWSQEYDDEFNKEPMEQCPYDPNHRVPVRTMEKHKASCRLSKMGYPAEEQKELYDPSVCYENSNVKSFLMDKSTQHQVILQARSAAPLMKMEGVFWRGQYSGQPVDVPQNHKRAVCDLTVADRLALYDHVVGVLGQQNEAAASNDDLYVDLVSKLQKDEGQNEPKSHLELMAEMRDYKRRRQSYRAKNVHITKKSYTEVIREVISVHSEELARQWKEDEDEKQLSRSDQSPQGRWLERGRSKSAESHHSHSKRHRSCERSHERDRERSREQGRERDRERSREPGRERDRERSRERRDNRERKKKKRKERDSRSPDGRHHNRKKKKKEDKERDK